MPGLQFPWHELAPELMCGLNHEPTGYLSSLGDFSLNPIKFLMKWGIFVSHEMLEGEQRTWIMSPNPGLFHHQRPSSTSHGMPAHCVTQIFPSQQNQWLKKKKWISPWVKKKKIKVAKSRRKTGYQICFWNLPLVVSHTFWTLRPSFILLYRNSTALGGGDLSLRACEVDSGLPSPNYPHNETGECEVPHAHRWGSKDRKDPHFLPYSCSSPHSEGVTDPFSCTQHRLTVLMLALGVRA